MNISFENQVALVTGAASGIGLATAKAFAQSGASVALADWNEKAVRSAAEELAGQGHKTLAIRCDVADDAQVEAMVDQTVAAFGRLDAAYNNAGVQNELAEAADQTREDFDRVVGINLRGVWSCMKFELRQMRKQGSGTIVNCSSLGGLVGSPERGIYHAAKHGVLGFTKSAALEYAARAFASMRSVPASSKRRCLTKWSLPVRVKPLRRWRRASRWDALAVLKKLRMLFCGFAATPQAT